MVGAWVFVHTSPLYSMDHNGPETVIAIGLFFGAYVGAKITGAISPATMKRAYGIFLLTVGVYFLLTSRTSPPKPAPAPVQAHPLADDQVH